MILFLSSTRRDGLPVTPPKLSEKHTAELGFAGKEERSSPDEIDHSRTMLSSQPVTER